MNGRHWIGVFAALACLLMQESAQGAAAQVEGIARAFPAGQETYIETHEFSGTTHRIVYRDTAGRMIAEKTLDYACDPVAPEWQQRDLRSGRKLGGHWAGPDYVLQRDDRSVRIRPEAPLVASSGFDHFVRQQWTVLTRGESVEFDFALPARLSTVGMRIHRTPAPRYDPGIVEWFRVEPSSGLFRIFAGAILLGYDEQRALAVYRGPSNIGDGEEVEIHYSRPAVAADLAQAHQPAASSAGHDPKALCTRHDA